MTTDLISPKAFRPEYEVLTWSVLNPDGADSCRVGSGIYLLRALAEAAMPGLGELPDDADVRRIWRVLKPSLDRLAALATEHGIDPAPFQTASETRYLFEMRTLEVLLDRLQPHDLMRHGQEQEHQRRFVGVAVEHPPTGAAVVAAAAPPDGRVGVNVEVVRAALLEMMLNKEPYMSRKALGELVGCSPSQIGKAINSVPALRAWKALHAPKNRASVKATSMEEAAVLGVSDDREKQPWEAAAASEEAEQAGPDQDGLDQLVADSVKDNKADPSPLTPDDPDNHIEVREYKRAFANPSRTRRAHVRGRSESTRQN